MDEQVRATVLIPTFDHGPMLRYSIPSALEQTIRNIEVFVVGDGVPDVTREIVGQFVRKDERVRFFDNPKGPHREFWQHVLGCRQWLVLDRDTATNTVGASRPARDAARQR